MADEVDIANDLAAAEAEAAVKAAVEGRAGPFAHLRPTGRCAWCDEPVPPGRTHCAPSVDSCHEDHMKRMRFDR